MQRLIGICSVLISLAGCVVPQTYNQFAYNGMSKEELFEKASRQSLDFQQIYYDDKTNIEVFFLKSANWWNAGDVGIISVFTSVTKPSECPFSSQKGACSYILYPESGMFDYPPFAGNGLLEATYRTDQLALLSAEGDSKSGYLLAAYQVYIERREAETKQLEFSGECASSSLFVRNCAELAWKKEGLAYDRRMAELKAASRTSSIPSKKSATYAGTYGSRVTKHGNTTPSRIGSNMFDTLIDAAITVWIHKALDVPLPGEISEENLRKIEEASSRGARTAIRKEKNRKRTGDLLSAPMPSIGY